MKSLTAASNSQKKTGLGSPAGGAWELGNLGVDLVLFCPFFPDQLVTESDRNRKRDCWLLDTKLIENLKLTPECGQLIVFFFCKTKHEPMLWDIVSHIR